MTAYVVWGSELSPFTLKVQRLLTQAGLSHRLVPASGGWLTNWRYGARRKALVNGLIPLTYPQTTSDDEYPLVPFIFADDGGNFYDSSAFADWLDQQHGTRYTPADPGVNFLVRLIDEYADEFGLYCVHHNRWKVSAYDNNAGERLAQETRRAFPMSKLYGRWFARRQVRRLPYLFSVAPQGFTLPNLSTRLQPPSIAGFPPTHDFLEDSFGRLLAALEHVLTQQSYLFGDAFTLADAAIAGQLGMNLKDPSAAQWMKKAAPCTHSWVERLNSAEQLPSSGPIVMDEQLRQRLMPLVDEIRRIFIPLMQQNYAAVQRAKANLSRTSLSKVKFNEAGFNRRQSLYDGELDGTAFRHVAKTFQAKTWRTLCQHSQALGDPIALEWLHSFGLHASDFQLERTT